MRNELSERLEDYRRSLLDDEKSRMTIDKYVRDAKAFARFVDGRIITKELVIEYKDKLIEGKYAVRSINSMLSAVNSFLAFVGMYQCRVKSIKVQKEIYCSKEKELSKAEYKKLLQAARGNQRLYVLLQTICSTGIRVSELNSFTVENVKKGEVVIYNKGKIRKILIPSKLKKLLLHYMAASKIRTGPVFKTKNGNSIDRSNVWREMKRLCLKAGVNPEKVFPHNLRRLFARAFYEAEKDIVKLADILGHGNINTTRIYLMTTSDVFMRKIEKLNLVYTT